MGQYPLLYFIVNSIDIPRLTHYIQTLLPEHIEERAAPCRGGIERTLNRNNVLRVVFLVVREDHQLRDIQERAKCLIPESRIDSFAFSEHTLVVVGLLDFYERQGQSVYEAGDVWSEIVVRLGILARELRGAMPKVVIGIVEVYESHSTIRGYFLIELTAEVVVFRRLDEP